MKNKEYELLEQKLSSLITQKFSNIIDHKRALHGAYVTMSTILMVSLMGYMWFSFDEIFSNKIHGGIVIVIFIGLLLIISFYAADLDNSSDRYIKKHLEETREIAQTVGNRTIATLCDCVLESLTEAQKKRIAAGARTVDWNMKRCISDFALH